MPGMGERELDLAYHPPPPRITEGGFSVWIEADHWTPGSWDPRDTNSDVIVTLADGTRWTAAFVTFRNVETLRANYAASGECLRGAYVWCTNMILVDEITRERIEAVVSDLLAESGGRLDHAFDGPLAPREEASGDDA